MSAHLTTALAGCVLRPWRAQDKVDLVRHANNRRVWRNMTHTFPHPYTEDDADLWLRIAADSGPSIQLAIAVDGRAVGGIGAIAGEGTMRRLRSSATGWVRRTGAAASPPRPPHWLRASAPRACSPASRRRCSNETRLPRASKRPDSRAKRCCAAAPPRKAG